jgi:hypothetical protein
MEEQTPTQQTARGKYELSLAEFPISVFSKTDKERKFLEYRDTIMGKDNQPVERIWRVYPDAKTGFGSASTLSTLYELFQIWKEQEFRQKTILFGSIYALAQRKGIVPTNTAYESLRKDLRCLVGIVIEAKNAFWDNEKRAYVDAYFHLFERVKFYKEKTSGQAMLPFSCIEASDELFGSIVSNSLMVTEFSSTFFHSLKPTEQRLALYLSKMLRNQEVHKRDLMKLASQLPLTTDLKKKAKQQLKLVTQGLITKGFKLLAGFDFEDSANGGENIVFYRQGQIPKRPARQSCNKGKARQALEAVNPDYAQLCLLEDILGVCGDEQSVHFYKKVAKLVPQEQIYQALAEVKEVRDLGTIKKSRGALFTKLIKDKAGRLDISL